MKGKSKWKKLCRPVSYSLAGARAYEVVECHAQRINTSFRLVITNQQSPDSGDFVARKFQCKVTRPFFFPSEYKRRKICLATRLPLPKCEGDDKGLQALFVFLHQFLSFSRLSRSLHNLSLSSLPSSTPQHSQSAHAKYEKTLNSLSIVIYCSDSPYMRRTKP